MTDQPVEIIDTSTLLHPSGGRDYEVCFIPGQGITASTDGPLICSWQGVVSLLRQLIGSELYERLHALHCGESEMSLAVVSRAWAADGERSASARLLHSVVIRLRHLTDSGWQLAYHHGACAAVVMLLSFEGERYGLPVVSNSCREALERVARTP